MSSIVQSNCNRVEATPCQTFHYTSVSSSLYHPQNTFPHHKSIVNHTQIQNSQSSQSIRWIIPWPSSSTTLQWWRRFFRVCSCWFFWCCSSSFFCCCSCFFYWSCSPWFFWCCSLWIFLCFSGSSWFFWGCSSSFWTLMWCEVRWPQDNAVGAVWWRWILDLCEVYNRCVVWECVLCMVQRWWYTSTAKHLKRCAFYT